MTEYIFIAIILFVLSIRQNKWTFIISLLLLIFIGGFRGVDVGTDTKNYALLFDWTSNGISTGHYIEPGYLLLQRIVIFLNCDYQLLIIISMSFSLITVSLFAYKASKRPQLVLLCYFFLYYYFYSFNLTRQYLAIPLVLLSFHYFANKKMLLYYLFLFFAFLFHYSSIVGLILLLVNYFRPTNKALILFVIFSFIVGMSNTIPYVFSLLEGFLPEAYYNYSLAGLRESSFSMSRLMLVFFNIYLLRLFRDDQIYLIIFTIGICMLNLFAFQPIIARLAQYFTIAQIAIIPNIERSKQDELSLLKVISYIYMIVLWGALLMSNVGEVTPYSFSDIFELSG